MHMPVEPVAHKSIRDPLSDSILLPCSIHHGAVTQNDWFALVESLLRVHGALSGKLKGPGLVVEVGTLRGKTTCGILRVVEIMGWRDVDVLTIDTEKNALSSAKSLIDGMSGKRKNHVIFANSTARKHFDLVPDFCKREIAWAFIDGCHCENCVLDDISAIAPCMISGAEISFHDSDNQHEHGMLVHERYHGDGVKRLYGAATAIVKSPHMKDFELVEKVTAQKRPSGAPTPLFGGLQVWRKI